MSYPTPEEIRISFTNLRHRLARRIAPDLAWNSDMSRVIDRLIVENDRLREKLAALEGSGGR